MASEDFARVEKDIHRVTQESTEGQAVRRTAYQNESLFTEHTSKSVPASGENNPLSRCAENHAMTITTHSGSEVEDSRFRTCRDDQPMLPSDHRDTGSLHVETSSPVRTSSSTIVQGTDQLGGESPQTTADIFDDEVPKPQGVEKSSLLGIGMQFKAVSEVNGCAIHSRPQALSLSEDDQDILDRI